MAHTRYHLPPEEVQTAVGPMFWEYIVQLHRHVYGDNSSEIGTLDGRNVVPVEELLTDSSDTSQGLKPDGSGGLEFGPVGALTAQYVVLQADDDLTDERVLALLGTNILITDAGAGASLTIDVSPQGAGSSLDADTTDGVQEATWTYIDGTRAFTGTMGGITPVADADLATKLYVDTKVTGTADAAIGTIPSGAIDGANVDYVLDTLPSADASVSLYRNGLRLKNTSPTAPATVFEFRASGQNIDLFTAPVSGDILYSDYVKLPAAATIIGELPSGTQDGANKTFTLANTPTNNTNPGVYLNGFRLTKVATAPASTQYSLATATLTLGLAPNAGDTLYCDYSTGNP